MPLGALSIIQSRIPILLISKIKKAEAKAVKAVSPKNINIVIGYLCFITLSKASVKVIDRVTTEYVPPLKKVIAKVITE